MSLSISSFAAALKQHYSTDRIENMCYKDNPFLAMVSKMEQFGGENLVLPIITGNIQGRSADIATAISNQTDVQVKKFTLTRVSDYAIASIGNEVLEASKGNANAFMEAATTQIDSAIDSATRSLAIALYGNGSGSRGQVANSSFATTALQLSQPDDVVNFEVGQKYVTSTADGGGSVKAGTLTVVSVNRDSGVVTMSANLSTGIATIAQNDYLFIQGDYGVRPSGLRAWLPDSDPSATPFFGVDRSVDPTRLAGIRYDGSAMPIEEALISAASRAAREGAKPTHCFMNYTDYANLEKALGSKVQYIDLKVKADIGFRGMLINGPRGPINVVADQNCPVGRAFMLDLSVWKLYSLNKAIRIMDSDGLKMLRESNADGVQVRVVSYLNLGCRAPGWNVTVRLS